MTCRIYKNFYNPSNPGVQSVNKLSKERAEILEGIREKKLSPVAIDRFNKENSAISYVFCDGKFHHRSKCDSWAVFSLGFCPDYQHGGKSEI